MLRQFNMEQLRNDGQAQISINKGGKHTCSLFPPLSAVSFSLAFFTVSASLFFKLNFNLSESEQKCNQSRKSFLLTTEQHL